MPQIKAVIFDWGDVCSTGGFKELIIGLWEKRGITEEKFNTAWESMDKEYMKGKIKDRDFWPLLSSKLGVKLTSDDVKKVLVNYGINKKTMRIVKKVKANCQTALLSDNTQIIEDYIQSKIKLADYFDVVVFSDKVGFAKPEKQIFHIVLEKLDRKPEECLFFDDKPINVEGARKIGIKAYKFHSTEQMESVIKHYLKI